MLGGLLKRHEDIKIKLFLRRRVLNSGLLTVRESESIGYVIYFLNLVTEFLSRPSKICRIVDREWVWIRIEDKYKKMINPGLDHIKGGEPQDSSTIQRRHI